MSTVEKSAFDEGDPSELPPQGNEWGALVWPFRWWAKHPWFVSWLGFFAVPVVEPGGLMMSSLIALVYASWVQGVRVTYRFSRVKAVAIVSLPAAAVSAAAVAESEWGGALVALFLIAGVPALDTMAIRTIRRRRGLPSEEEVTIPVGRRRRFAVGAVVVLGLIVWFFWTAGAPRRNARSAHDGIRPGMTLSEVLQLAEAPFFANGASAPESPEGTAPPALSIMGEGTTFRLKVGDNRYGDSLTREELLRVLHEKADEITPQSLWFVFRSHWIPARVSFTVTFGDDGRVEKISGTNFWD